MTARTTYEAAVSSAATTKAATVAAAELTHQTTIDANNSVVGYLPNGGNYGNLASAVKTANAAKLASIYNAEVAKQASFAAARDTLRNAGTDSGAF